MNSLFNAWVEKWERSTALREVFTAVDAAWAFDDGVTCILVGHILSTAQKNGWSHNGLKVERAGKRGKRILWRVTSAK